MSTKEKIEFQVICLNCFTTYTISFKNQKGKFWEYTMAVEQQLSNPCPQCETGKLDLIKDKQVV